MIVGYARVSTEKQDLTRQMRALRAVRCDKIFSDTASGKTLSKRPQLAAALAELAEGDELVLAEWSRATRSMWDGLKIIKDVIDAGATIKVLDRPYIDLTTPMGQGVMALFSAMAEDDRLSIIARTRDGRAIARENGVKFGRKPTLTSHQQEEARGRVAKGENPRAVAKSYNVSRSTIARL